MFEKELLIDGKGHMLGRLASVVAHELLRGQRVVVVRAESILKSGHIFKNKLIFGEYLNKAKNTNPRRGAFHFRSPAMVFGKAVRGMVPRKTPRGNVALGHLKVFNGIPHPYDMKKRMVIPDALKVLRLRQHRKYTVLADLCSQMGWKKKDLMTSLEQKRKEKSAKFHEMKQKKLVAREKANSSKEVQKINTELAKYGF